MNTKPKLTQLKSLTNWTGVCRPEWDGNQKHPQDDTSPTSAGKERPSIKRHSRGKHVQGTYRDLGIGLRKFQNSIELKAYKFLIPGAKIVSHKHRETRLVHTKEGSKLSREKSGADCGGLSWRYWRSGLEWKARECDGRRKKRSRESRGEQS